MATSSDPAAPAPPAASTTPMEAVGQLATALDALAAVAALVRIEAEGLDVDVAVRDLLEGITRSAIGDLGTVPDAQRAGIVALVRTFLHQAADLVEHPDRPSGWTDPDERLLQSIGQVSMGIAAAIATAAAARPSLAERLGSDGAVVIDVGTGAGWLAIALARAFPAVRVIGVDIFPPALALAARNVEAAGLGDRIEVRAEDARTLAPATADVVWVPLPFLSRAVALDVIGAAVGSLRRGGWLVAGTFPGPGGTLHEQAMTLRTIRSGGHPWTADELTSTMTSAGLADVAEIPRSWPAPVRLYAGRVP